MSTRMLALVTALTCVLACSHDLEALAPSVEQDLARWLPQASAECKSCLNTRCLTVAEQCLDERDCQSSVQSCYPPNPGCAQRTPLVRDFSVCLAHSCADECRLPEQALDCLGKYSWPQRDPRVIPFDLRLNKFGDLPFEGSARVATCFGSTPTCDDARAFTLRVNEIVPASYTNDFSSDRPSFHVTGEGLRPLLFYEDGTIMEGYVVNIPALTQVTYAFLVSLLRVEAVPQQGTINVAMFDCVGRPMDGVDFRIRRDGVTLSGAAMGTAYYFDEVGPQLTSQAARTGSNGQGGFANLTPGLYGVSAHLGDRLLANIDSVTVLPDTVTHINLMPLSLDEVVP